MSIDGVEFGLEEVADDERVPEGKPTETIAIEEMKEDFKEPIILHSKEEITATFERMKDEPRICISIPVAKGDDEVWRNEILTICSTLRREIFKYFGLKKGDPIDEGIEFNLGEKILNSGKHCFPNERIGEISVMATKSGRMLSFRLSNPTKPDVDSRVIDPTVNIDRDPDPEMHGLLMAEKMVGSLEEDLKREGCPPLSDKQFYVADQDGKKVGFLEKFEATLPEEK